MEITAYIKTTDVQTFSFDAGKVSGTEMIERALCDILADSKGTVREMCSHILNAGGKRVRPLLVLYSGLVFSPASRELVQAAVAAEVIHMASLVHDDIIDNSILRRGKPTIHQGWGNYFAVICGDYLFAKAFGVLAGNRLTKSMDLMVTAIDNMCQGEIIQAEGRFNTRVTLKDYYDCIAKKTAIFLECCCKSGAAISGADDYQIGLMGEYGLHIGLAFQMIDDLLDINGDTGKMGKPKNEDICCGNITMPFIFLLSDTKYGTWFKQIIEERTFGEQVMSLVRDALKDSGIIDRCFDIAKSHVEKAKKCLDLLPKSEYVDFLHGLADILHTRAN